MADTEVQRSPNKGVSVVKSPKEKNVEEETSPLVG